MHGHTHTDTCTYFYRYIYFISTYIYLCHICIICILFSPILTDWAIFFSQRSTVRCVGQRCGDEVGAVMVMVTRWMELTNFLFQKLKDFRSFLCLLLEGNPLRYVGEIAGWWIFCRNLLRVDDCFFGTTTGGWILISALILALEGTPHSSFKHID